jgi:hypothetical protein
MKIRLASVTLLVVCLLLIGACSETTETTEIPIAELVGRVTPWGSKSHVEGRKIVLCQRTGEPTEGECVLSKTASTTDKAGDFTASEVQAGSYFLLYDSGLSDFDQAMDRWGGQTLRFNDPDWLSEFLGVDVNSEPVEFRVPEGISHSPHEGWLNHYCTITLSIGNSPFIVAHDMLLAESERDIRCQQVDITPGQVQTIVLQVAYFGDRYDQ